MTNTFLYDGDAVLLEKQGSTTTATYTYGNGLIRKDGETPLFDGLGSERTVTNSSQTVTGTATLRGVRADGGDDGQQHQPVYVRGDQRLSQRWGCRADACGGKIL